MKTLVTGANGHLGANLIRQLLAQGRQVKAFVRPNADLRGLTGLDVELVRGDVLDEDSIERALRGCHVLFHTATTYRYWHPKPQVIFQTAVQGTQNVLRAASRYRKLEKMVYTSSVAAIGFGTSPANLKNETHFNDEKISIYNQAKTISEREALAGAKNLPLVIVNPATILGPFDFKPTPSGQLVIQFLKKGAPLYWEGGMNLVDVSDVAKGHLLAEQKGKVGERYILGGDNVTIYEIYAALADLTGGQKPLMKMGHGLAVLIGTTLELVSKLTQKEPLLTREVGKKLVGKYAFYDLSKSKEELGYAPCPYRMVLAKALDWFVNSAFISHKIKKKIKPHYLHELEKLQKEESASVT